MFVPPEATENVNNRLLPFQATDNKKSVLTILLYTCKIAFAF